MITVIINTICRGGSRGRVQAVNFEVNLTDIPKKMTDMGAGPTRLDPHSNHSHLEPPFQK